jgi:hypothetical protein
LESKSWTWTATVEAPSAAAATTSGKQRDPWRPTTRLVGDNKGGRLAKGPAKVLEDRTGQSTRLEGSGLATVVVLGATVSTMVETGAGNIGIGETKFASPLPSLGLGSARANSIDWGATVPSWVVVAGLRYWVVVGMVELGVQGHAVVWTW